MPARTDDHRQGGGIKAVFFPICEDVRELSPRRASEIIAKMLQVVGGHHDFTEYLALVESGPRASRVIPEPPSCIRGHAEFVRIEKVREVLAEKIEHEKPEFRKRGRKSYVPEAFLRPDVCVLIVGSRPFLCENLDLYLEHRGPLRRELIEAFKLVAGLSEASRAGTAADTYCEILVATGQFYAGNFDALWERVVRTRMTTEDLAEHLPQLSPELAATLADDDSFD